MTDSGCTIYSHRWFTPSQLSDRWLRPTLRALLACGSLVVVLVRPKGNSRIQLIMDVSVGVGMSAIPLIFLRCFLLVGVFRLASRRVSSLLEVEIRTCRRLQQVFTLRSLRVNSIVFGNAVFLLVKLYRAPSESIAVVLRRWTLKNLPVGRHAEGNARHSKNRRSNLHCRSELASFVEWFFWI